METVEKTNYMTATSLTARHINRKIILNIIHRLQPISRADTARETGLQRSTVSLIVDELIKDNWVIEGEHGRIPRGRRPIYLHINPKGAGLLGLHISSNTINVAVADLNGEIQWTKSLPMTFSSGSLRKALRELDQSEQLSKKYQIKGIGVSLDDVGESTVMVQEIIKEVFDTDVMVESAAIACGKWFLLNHKDSRLANDHLVSINMNDGANLGVIIAGRPLRGAHGKAGAILNNGTETKNGRSNGNGHAGEDLEKRLRFAVEAYDPGVILITGDTKNALGDSEKLLSEKLSSSSVSNTRLRVLTSGEGEDSIYLKGAVAVILNHFLDECPT